ncbi:MAG: CDP-alcohol phosphatidyltransferase family protein, partial [Xanthomonadaceae bacterium]|nr:CDP-alcohol phosphatidyltransferase family protein [Xanthomonadaceae bacterium]
LAWLIRDARYDWAVVVAAIAGLTDALDGFLAKRCGWQSWLGGLLDPIADKLMLVTCFLTLGLVGAHPAWLTWLVVGRDVVIVAGAMAWHGLIGRIHAQPTHLSKLTTCVQILYVLMQLLHLSSWLDLPAHLLDVMIGLTAVLTAVSGLQYVVVWSGKALRWRKAGA